MADWKYPLLTAFPELSHGTYTEAPTAIPASASHLLNPVQVHGTHFHAIHDPHEPLPPCDAIATSLKGVALMIRHADCQAALVYDPEKKVIAAIHAGWRGLVQEIYPLTIARLHDHYGCNPQHLRIIISPSLGPENAEFKHFQEEFPESYWTYQVKPNYFDLRKIAKDQLLRTGVLPEHLFISSIDTFNPESCCPSYRRTKTTSRMGSFIARIDKELINS